MIIPEEVEKSLAQSDPPKFEQFVRVCALSTLRSLLLCGEFPARNRFDSKIKCSQPRRVQTPAKAACNFSQGPLFTRCSFGRTDLYRTMSEARVFAIDVRLDSVEELPWHLTEVLVLLFW